MFERFFAAFIVIFLSPLFFLISFLILIFSGRPIFFTQKREGKGKRPLFLYKFRTMVVGAEKEQNKYADLNQADGPVFKIKNDPRYTKIGKVLSRFGLDELPQLLNIAKGEMAFVGPRPLPVAEATQIPQKYHTRFSVLPGITSLWVIRGGHALSFDEWMQLDLWYVKHKSFWLDMQIGLGTTRLLLKMCMRRFFLPE